MDQHGAVLGVPCKGGEMRELLKKLGREPRILFADKA